MANITHVSRVPLCLSFPSCYWGPCECSMFPHHSPSRGCLCPHSPQLVANSLSGGSCHWCCRVQLGLCPPTETRGALGHDAKWCRSPRGRDWTWPQLKGIQVGGTGTDSPLSVGDAGSREAESSVKHLLLFSDDGNTPCPGWGQSPGGAAPWQSPSGSCAHSCPGPNAASQPASSPDFRSSCWQEWWSWGVHPTHAGHCRLQ